MSEAFDPYHLWLSIKPKDQPPHHYRLLGIDLFEDDPEVIRDAAERQMAHVRKYQLGQHSAISQKMLNEIAAAKGCLLDREKKAAYDVAIKQKLGTIASAQGPPDLSIPLQPPSPPPLPLQPTSIAGRRRLPAASAQPNTTHSGGKKTYKGRKNIWSLYIGIGATVLIIVLFAARYLFERPDDKSALLAKDTEENRQAGIYLDENASNPVPQTQSADSDKPAQQTIAETSPKTSSYADNDSLADNKNVTAKDQGEGFPPAKKIELKSDLIHEKTATDTPLQKSETPAPEIAKPLPATVNSSPR